MALDRDRLGKDTRKRRKELGLSLEAVLDMITTEFICKKTLERIEKGSPSVSASKIRIYLEALQLDPREYMDKEELFDSTIDSSGLKEMLDSQLILYPSSSLGLDRPVRNLADFLYNMSLFKTLDLADIINKICLWPGNRDPSYIISLIDWAYEKIPDSPAKEYCEYLRQSTTGRYRNLRCSSRCKSPVRKHPKDTDKNRCFYQEKVRAFYYMLLRADMYSRLDTWKLKEQREAQAGSVAFGAVRLRKNRKKLYWFNVCGPLCQYLVPNCTVTVETSGGIFKGILTKFMVSGDHRELAQDLGYFPTRDIRSVYSKVPMDRIYIQPSFAEHPPSDQKVNHQKHEWLKDGRFKTRVVIRSDGVLLDGYSAYLAAIKLNMPSLYCEVIPERIKRTIEMKEK